MLHNVGAGIIGCVEYVRAFYTNSIRLHMHLWIPFLGCIVSVGAWCGHAQLKMAKSIVRADRWAGASEARELHNYPSSLPPPRAHSHRQQKTLSLLTVLLLVHLLLACACLCGRGIAEQATPTTVTPTAAMTLTTPADGYSVPAPMTSGQSTDRGGEQEQDYMGYPAAWSTPGQWSCLLWCSGGAGASNDCTQFFDVCCGAILTGVVECVAAFTGCLGACGHGFVNCCSGCVNCTGNCCDCIGDCSCCP